MTLIIGCVTSEYAILAGDTQLTFGDLQRGENLKRETEIKVKKYSARFMMGILGRWSYFYPTGDGKATYINYYDTLQKSLFNNENEVGFLKEFLPGKTDVEAVAIYVSKNEQGFSIGSVSSKDDLDMAKIKIGERDIIFNEPFCNLKENLITGLLVQFSETYNLDDSLGDAIFLLNNIILNIISNGRELDIRNDDGATFFNVKNTVGGYVTIQVLTKDNHTCNCLYKPYHYDYNTLLDQTTFAFSTFADRCKDVKYLDNLAMLIRGSAAQSNDPYLRDSLIKCIERQLKFLAESNLVRIYVLNDFITLANKKYNLNFDLLQVEEENGLLSLGSFLEDERDKVDLNYIKRFI